MNLIRFLLPGFLLVCTVLSTEVLAHKVNLFAYVEGEEVYVEGYFVDGKKAQNSKVQVFSSDGELLLEGITDNEGQYRFPVPQKTDLKIVMNAGMGHQSDFVISADELGNPAEESQASTEHDHSLVEQIAPQQEHTHQTENMTLNNQELEAAISKAVNEAIKPLVRELSASQEKASLSGIVGGVGYIIGILGLFAFFKARQDKQ